LALGLGIEQSVEFFREADARSLESHGSNLLTGVVG
jgi:hypothetical protein